MELSVLINLHIFLHLFGLLQGMYGTSGDFFRWIYIITYNKISKSFHPLERNCRFVDEQAGIITVLKMLKMTS